MTTTLLASFPSPSRGVWHLGPVPIRAYALCIIVGIIAALVIGDRRWAARGGERGVIYDIALWAVPFGLLGGRLYHLITDWRTYFGPTGAGADAALRIWDGGLGIWGAVALGGVGAWIGCRRRSIPLPAFGDAIAPGIVLAQAIGRLGNYFNQELYGRETTVPWGMEIFYRRDPSGIVDVHSLDGVSTGQVAEVVQPTFLYELLWNVLIFVVLIYVDRRFKIGHGRLFALYVAGYCVGRFGIELLRNDPATLIDGIRVNSFTSMFVFIGAVVYIVLAPRGREDPDALRATWMTDEEPESDTERVTVPAAVAAGLGADDFGPDIEPSEAEAADQVEEFPTGPDEVVEEAAAAEEGEAETEEPAEPEAAEESAAEEGEADAIEVVEAGEAAAEESLADADEESAEQPESEAAEEPVSDDAEAEAEDVETLDAEEAVAEQTAGESPAQESDEQATGELVSDEAEAEAEDAGAEDAEALEIQEPTADQAADEAPVEPVGDEAAADSDELADEGDGAAEGDEAVEAEAAAREEFAEESQPESDAVEETSEDVEALDAEEGVADEAPAESPAAESLADADEADVEAEPAAEEADAGVAPEEPVEADESPADETADESPVDAEQAELEVAEEDDDTAEDGEAVEPAEAADGETTEQSEEQPEPDVVQEPASDDGDAETEDGEAEEPEETPSDAATPTYTPAPQPRGRWLSRLRRRRG
ncbi:prolipoprotein diacylglyceryl transferase [Mycobacterium sp. pUA109]|uniref:prolipoprotein diacylglyceryl transferase n=1 Tax=Mycobacterium sp. pUA109 TaxID=3238982 RepID=UPI00351B369A